MAARAADDIELSNLDKSLYPDDGVTKGDLIDYYRAVADMMLAHLAGRPLVLHRFPHASAIHPTASRSPCCARSPARSATSTTRSASHRTCGPRAAASWRHWTPRQTSIE